MAKHARIRRLRAEREAAKEEEKARGPITEKEARERSAEWRRAGITSGHWVSGTRVRNEIKRTADFREKRPKKTRVKKRGRR